MTTPATLPAVEFEAPLVNPSPQGLYAVTAWTDVEGPSRFLGEGVRIRPHNYGGSDAFGVWDAQWCVDPEDATKGGERPDPDTEPFPPIVVWAYDQCDLTAPSQGEVRERVAHNLRLLEPIAVETEFAARLLSDAPTPTGVADVVAAVGVLEGALAVTNTVGFIHASPKWAAPAAAANLIIRSGASLKTPLGNTWVFGGGYGAGLNAALVATSPTFGWRDEVQIRDTIKHDHNQFVAIAERSVVVGYEAALAAATIT